LANIGQVIRATIREYDIAGRFGGEEFCIALPETHMSEAKAIAERIRAAVEESQVRAPTSAEWLKVSMSLGVASFPVHAGTAVELIHEA
ncbi:GGDEF domain-containing protein, partial [Klebsiella pneumoniae]|uniref:GGDEF domain-containing protein n=1 Tax=Klebsiella pneumoniae TaxID=573 RepID=UPI003013E339